MQGKHLFEYATIRFVPCVERGEFINVGVILFCQSQGFLQISYALDEARINAFSASTDIEVVFKCLKSFEKICAGQKEGGAIGKLPLSGRFRWITASRSTIIQTSAVHSGLCEHPGQTLEKLFKDLVC